MKRRKKFLKVGLLAIGAWLVFTACSIWNFGIRDRQVPSDCAIILGAAVRGDQPSPVFEERIKHALKLYQRGVVKKLLFTGGVAEGSEMAESTVGAAYARNAGVRAEDIAVEIVSRTTQENFRQAKQVMAAQQWRTAVIVSDPLHLKRAATMAGDLGIDAVTSPTPTSRYRTAAAKAKFLLRELLVYHVYLIMGK